MRRLDIPPGACYTGGVSTSELSLLHGAQPFFFPGSRTGCLLVHGFTGTPREVRWLGQYLNEQNGCTVYGPRLAGHATHPDDMLRASWREWYLDVLAGFQMLSEQCDRVFVLGLSMGGALCLTLAGREPVAGVVAMSTGHSLDDWRAPLLPVLYRFAPRIEKNDPSPEHNPFQQRVLAEQRARGEEPIGHPAYPYYPTRAIMEYRRVLQEMHASAPRITAPALFIYSRSDDVVPFHDLEKNPPLVTCEDKQVVILDDSLHVVTEDVERQTVFETVARFIAAHR